MASKKVKKETVEDSKVEKMGFEPNFTTRDPTKKEMDAWIKKHIASKVKSGKKSKGSSEGQ